jgi:hypothetical protein
VKVYPHYRPIKFMMPLIALGLAVVGMIAGLSWSLSRGPQPGPPFPVFLIVLAAFGPQIWIYASTAFEIRLGDDGILEFVGVLRRTRVAVTDVRSIAPSIYPQIYVARSSQRNVRFDGRLNGLHELVAEIKRRNPSVELSGI